MRYILDDLGYIEEVSSNLMNCNDKECTAYSGTIPEGYETLEDWVLNANIRAYKLDADGNLIFDEARDAELQEEYKDDSYFCKLNKYSTEEIKVGTWIDGKPIYRKVYQYTTGAGANPRNFSEAGITDIDAIVNISGFTLQPNSNNYVPLSYYNSSTDWANFYTGGKNAFSVRCGSSYGYGATTIIFEYTKTTD